MLSRYAGVRSGKLVFTGVKLGDGKHECKCDCGRTHAVSVCNIGYTKSCGHCIGRVTHGMSNHLAYDVYLKAKGRCNNPNDKDYGRYGGRGIEFRLPYFPEFWMVMGSTWKKGLELDRIDNDGHYEIGNVRWVTHKENSLNKNLRWLTHGGKTLCLSDWARQLRICNATLRERIQKWGLQKALTTPKHVWGKDKNPELHNKL